MAASDETASLTSEDDESAEKWTEDIEKTFLKTLSCLKSKDPKIYDENFEFFHESLSKNRKSLNCENKKQEPPLFLRDFERKIILDKSGILADEDCDKTFSIPCSRTHVEEQKLLRESFKPFLNNDEDENDCGEFLKIKIKSSEEQAKEEEEYIKWLKGHKCELSDKYMESQLKYLHDYWTDPKLDENEQFLRDYILNKRYLEAHKTDENSDRLVYDVPSSEEEGIFDECEQFEEQYNFRFEEPDKNFIKTYPRLIENSLRRKNEKRKQKREMKKLKKQQQLKQKHVEVKYEKKQKKEELRQRIEKLKEITGNSQFGFDIDDLENDFDPDEYSERMRELFNETFYKQDNLDNTKPVFSDSDDGNLSSEDVNDFDESNKSEMYHDAVFSSDACTANRNTKMKDVNDASTTTDNKMVFTRSSCRKSHKKSTLAECIAKKKPLFDETEKTFEEYVDEYYGLDFEDIVGDIPCRFKYRKVIPNSFGLTIEEILAADDKELNKWCSMQKIDAFRSEQNEKYDLKVYSRRARDLNLKKKFLPSLFAEKTENDLYHSNSPQNRVKNEKTSGIFIKQKQFDKSQQSNTQSLKREMNITRNTCRTTKERKQSHFRDDVKSEMKKSNNPSVHIFTNVSDERLKAYGIHPKKFKNKIKFGSRKK